MDRKAPLGAKILAVLVGLQGLMGLGAIILLTAGGLSAQVEWTGLITSTMFLTAGILSIIYLAGAVLVFKTHKYGWWAMVVWAATKAIEAISQALYGGFLLYTGLIGLAIVSVVFWYLFRVRNAFGIKLFSKINHTM